MNNPYKTPESQIGTEVERYKPGIGWKILFFILVPLEIWSQFDAFTLNEYDQPLWWLIISLGIYTVYFVGLFGLAFAKKIGNATFWLRYLPIQIATDIYEVYSVLLTENLQLGETVTILAFAIPFIAITWWSTYKYHKVIDSFG